MEIGVEFGDHLAKVFGELITNQASVTAMQYTQLINCGVLTREQAVAGVRATADICDGGSSVASTQLAAGLRFYADAIEGADQPFLSVIEGGRKD